MRKDGGGNIGMVTQTMSSANLSNPNPLESKPGPFGLVLLVRAILSASAQLVVQCAVRKTSRALPTGVGVRNYRGACRAQEKINGIEANPIHVPIPLGSKPIQFMFQIRWNRSQSNSCSKAVGIEAWSSWSGPLGLVLLVW